MTGLAPRTINPAQAAIIQRSRGVRDAENDSSLVLKKGSVIHFDNLCVIVYGRPLSDPFLSASVRFGIITNGHELNTIPRRMKEKKPWQIPKGRISTSGRVTVESIPANRKIGSDEGDAKRKIRRMAWQVRIEYGGGMCYMQKQLLKCNVQ